MANYTDEMVKTLKELDEYNLEISTAVGEKLGKSAASITAKIKSLGITYVAKVRKATIGVTNKKVYVAELEGLLGVVMVSAQNMTKDDLVKAVKAVKALKVAEYSGVIYTD